MDPVVRRKDNLIPDVVILAREEWLLASTRGGENGVAATSRELERGRGLSCRFLLFLTVRPATLTASLTGSQYMGSAQTRQAFTY
jgi:hypothetical protein